MKKNSWKKWLPLLILSAIVVWAFSGMWILVLRVYEVPAHIKSDEVQIVALADLHGRTFGINQWRLVRKVKNSNPDIIVYLGDMIDRESAERSMDSFLQLNKELVKIAPVYFVEGNHEDSVRSKEPDIYHELHQTLEEQGAVCLNDATVSLTISTVKVNLAGLTIHYSWSEEDYKFVDELRGKDGVNVLLCHYPESVIWREAFDGGGGLDLALCGHTHGGLIRVPFKGGLIAPEQPYWPMYDMGAYQIYTDLDVWDSGCV